MCRAAQALWLIVWSCTFVVANPVVQENPAAAFCAVTIGINEIPIVAMK